MDDVLPVRTFFVLTDRPSARAKWCKKILRAIDYVAFGFEIHWKFGTSSRSSSSKNRPLPKHKYHSHRQSLASDSTSPSRVANSEARSRLSLQKSENLWINLPLNCSQPMEILEQSPLIISDVPRRGSPY